MKLNPNTPVNLLQLETVDSTNSYLLDHADILEDLTLVTAKEQTAGRGRLGREWISNKDENCCASWLLKNWDLPAYQATWLLSMAVLATIYECAPDLEPWVKWPNDIMIGDKKLAGMLSECHLSKDGKNILALGVGVNLNMTQAQLSKIPQRATSLSVELNEKINGDFFEETLAFSLKQVYIIYQQEGIQSIYNDWVELNGLLGEKVEFIDPCGVLIEGVVMDVTFEGEIVIESTDGEKSYQCGDIQLKKKTYNYNNSKEKKNEN